MMKGRRILKKYFNKLLNLFPPKSELTIVTGANSKFFVTLKNLLRSIQEKDPDASVIVWDLGLIETEVKEIKQLFPSFKICKFRFENYPSYFNINTNAGEYAWKPVCIFESYKLIEKGSLLWLDAGCMLTGRLNTVRYVIQKYGFYSPYTATTIDQLTYPSVLSYFDLKNRTKKQMLSGGIVGFKAENPKAIAILTEWKELAQNKEIIAPEGSNKDNHRQDQSLLSCIYYAKYKNNPFFCRGVYNFQVQVNKGKIS